MTENIAATRRTMKRSRRTVGAVVLGMMVFGGSAAPVFSAQEQLSQVQALEASAEITVDGKMQKVLEQAVMLTKEGFWL